MEQDRTWGSQRGRCLSRGSGPLKSQPSGSLNVLTTFSESGVTESEEELGGFGRKSIQRRGYIRNLGSHFPVPLLLPSRENCVNLVTGSSSYTATGRPLSLRDSEPCTRRLPEAPPGGRLAASVAAAVVAA